jgi:hypothetical protein
MIGFIVASMTITFDYNQLKQLTILYCLTLTPFLTGLRVSALPL